MISALAGVDWKHGAIVPIWRQFTNLDYQKESAMNKVSRGRSSLPPVRLSAPRAFGGSRRQAKNQRRTPRIRKADTLTMAILLVVLYCARGYGQTGPPVILTVDLENIVSYEADVSDVSKFGTVTTRTVGTAANNFAPVIWLADVVAVNGKPAKGTWTVRGNILIRSTTPSPGVAIADSSAFFFFDWIVDIMQSDGTPIGTLMASGWGGAAKPPGAPSTFLQANMAVTGGTGAFLGVRGQAGQGGNIMGPRLASMSEDPALRRVLGGGTRRYVFHLIPLFRPEIVNTAGVPAVVPANDFALVTAANPARAGELLSVYAQGLGPTRPGVDPGQPFPASPLQPVNSPVEVTVNGKPAVVTDAVGFPGAVDGYQVNFRVPSDVSSGSATLQVSSGWIAGSGVRIAIQ